MSFEAYERMLFDRYNGEEDDYEEVPDSEWTVDEIYDWCIGKNYSKAQADRMVARLKGEQR